MTDPWLEILVRGNVTDWERTFLASLIKHTRQGRALSEKQRNTLDRIKTKFQRDAFDGELIEGSNDAIR
jgi:hypothetical protein